MESIGIEHFLDSEGRLAALVIRKDFRADGISFPTPSTFSQQVGVMFRRAGYVVEPHEHTPQRREIHDTVEVLFVRSGAIEVTLFDSAHKAFTSFQVGPLEAVLLASTGHGITFLEDSDVLEVKQGPYTETADKIRFLPND